SQQENILDTNSDRLARGYFAKAGATFDLGQDRLLLNYDIYHNNNDSYTLSSGIASILVSAKANVYKEGLFDAYDAANTNNV
ncbi:TonB-dependent receptor, partial [Chryseobacterium sp. SIMBA_029]